MKLWFFFKSAYIRSNQIMGWGEKAIEIRSVETGHLDGVFMHKRAQRLKFLCERNDKVSDFFFEGEWKGIKIVIKLECVQSRLMCHVFYFPIRSFLLQFVLVEAARFTSWLLVGVHFSAGRKASHSLREASVYSRSLKPWMN